MMDQKPRLTVYKAINKSLIAWNIKNFFNIPVYYKWDQKRVPKINIKTGLIKLPFILVDYDSQKREWYIQYININFEILSSTIDDITGTISITSNN